MRLTDFWIPAMEEIRAILAEPGQNAAAAADRMRGVLDGALEQAVGQGVGAEAAQASLFAVVAWADELAMTRDWAGASAWRQAPLQRHYFSTTRAGNEFFSRLEALPEEEIDVREVYALVMLAGFHGRYTYRPEEELVEYRHELLERVAQERSMAPLTPEEPLFPATGLTARLEARVQGRNSPSWTAFLIVVVPLLCLLALYLVLDASVAHMTTRALASLSLVL
jgi:type VI secretion system protein ImpK